MNAALDRRQQSNPESFRGGTLDCFVARAPRNDGGEAALHYLMIGTCLAASGIAHRLECRCSTVNHLTHCSCKRDNMPA
ncbi:hypothetical protein EAS56_06250 [Bradyrhizobium guangzhouense]|uniref:Uncharacterized protein n=1 Tax=Bradyrhizobium guangzhouense TaxID=1325095 RepID=A0AAE5WXQ8_9BRAD|nr:hypothetical protein XH91_05900 [Bradyrhizobium guangzhouense]RXH16589.1 hypothetical protein EAS56_06250 [Bradyrhizobium guangzhouense]